MLPRLADIASLTALLQWLAPRLEAALVVAAASVVLLALIVILIVLRARRRGSLRDAAAAQQSAAATTVYDEAEGETVSAGLERAPRAVTEPNPRGGAGLLRRRPSGDLRRSFRRAMGLLSQHVSGRNFRYEAPWFLMVGQADSGKSTVLRNAGLNLPMGQPPADVRRQPAACNWWFFDNGVVLDIAGTYILDRDGFAADDRGWFGLMRLLQWHRPRRPIDGIILSIPVTDLTDRQALDLDRLTTRAALIYRKLWEAQKILGMRVPVYVVITKCDAVPGFASLARELPGRLGDRMFGWSSPYTAGAGYSPGWLDEAWRSIQSELLRLQADILAARVQVAARDRLVTFPSAFGALWPSLRVYLNEVFKDSAYHESFIFRGVYFVGDVRADWTTAEILAGPETWQGAPEDGAPEPGITASQSRLAERISQRRHDEPEDRRPIFVRHLLEKKIFPEFGLARPTARRLLSENRLVLAAKAATLAVLLIGGIGVLLGYKSIDDSAGRLRHLTRMLAGELSHLSAIERGVEERRQDVAAIVADGGVLSSAGPVTTADWQAFAATTFPLMGNLAAMAPGDFRSLFLPASWFSAVPAKLRDVQRLAYDALLFRALRLELEGALLTVLTANPIDTDPDVAANVVGPMARLEFRRLRHYVSQLRGSEQRIAAFNRARQTGDARQLGDLIGAVLKVDVSERLPVRLTSLHGYNGETAIPEVAIARYRPAAAAKLRGLSAAWNAEAQQANDLRALMQGVAEQIDRLKRPDGGRPTAVAATSLDAEAEALRGLLGDLRAVEDTLAGKALFRFAGTAHGPDRAYQQLLDDVAQSALLGPGVREDMAQRDSRNFDELKQALAGYRSDATGPLLSPDETGRLRLAAGVAAIAGALADYVAQPFNAGGVERIFETVIPRGQRLTWDVAALEDATHLADAFELYLRDVVPRSSPLLRGRLRAAAERRFRARMIDQIAEAQIYSPAHGAYGFGSAEGQLELDVRNLDEVARQMIDLHDRLGRVGLPDVATAFGRLMALHAGRLLARIDALAEADRLYQPTRDFAWWQGDEPLNLRAFDVLDDRELVAYLFGQRGRIRILAEHYAHPVVAVLNEARLARDTAQRSVLFRWQRVLLELDAYERGRPGNSLELLEDFILRDLAAINPQNCVARLRGADLDTPTGDFFLSRRNALGRMVRERCRGLAGDGAPRRPGSGAAPAAG